ncbi:hypothetical protein DL764_002553 [Monosporascus ibericus]|uniref:AB hydrolase-1 domain-containing protein n=1 Tax=Monosporascus ibericus TaxID=155417 RepID=A0A4Q4TN87_9PEZI|nr:hypothetical protein DL764_002553 [Monosporascus ibericus]
MAEAGALLASTGIPASDVSKHTLQIAGLQTDIYGLSELPATATSVSCLWLHHPRLQRKEGMADTAHEVLSKYHYQRQKHNREDGAAALTNRGLIAVAFDQRNHGTRLVDPLGNESWSQGNRTHAQDMFATVSGMVNDTVHLIDVLEGYLFGAGDGPGALAGDGVSGKRRIDQHLVLGVSLGGHSAWELIFAEPRVTAGVMVIGCPDYMGLLKDRARKSKLETYLGDEGASFLGSKDFPEALISACQKYDPKGILFGAGDIPSAPITTAEQERLRPILDSKIRGKRFQVLSGGADKLVPYSAGVPFLHFFKDAVATWYRDGNVYVEDNVYPEVGHQFHQEMVKDAVRFVLNTVSQADESSKEASAKI